MLWFVQGLYRKKKVSEWIHDEQNHMCKIYRYNPTKEDELQSNMVILEVGMPSGFLIEKENLNGLLKQPNIKLVESKRGETVTDIYLDQMQHDQEICIEVQAYQSHKVAENKPAPVRIYDYYDSCKLFEVLKIDTS